MGLLPAPFRRPVDVRVIRMIDHVRDTESRPDIYVGDDAAMLCRMLESEWPDTPGEPHPVFVYDREKLMMDSRYGTVFVYLVSSPKTVADTDFRTVDRTPRLAIKLACRSRDLMFRWARVIESIMQSFRRSMRTWGPYSYLEVINERPDNSADGWYAYTYDVKLTGFHIPLVGSGLYKACDPCEYHDYDQGGL